MELPNTIKQFPVEVQQVYTDTFNKVNKGDESTAHAVAFQVIKNRLTPVTTGLVALSEAFKHTEYYTFDLTPVENRLIINASGNEITFEGILATTDSFQQDAVTVRKFSESALIDLAEQINKFGSSHPDIDHETMDALVKQYGNNYELIMNAVPKSKGIIKSIQAVYENGKLWIKGILDSRYKKLVGMAKGMSIEALSQDVDINTSTINKSKYLGFTFAVQKNPRIARAQITSVV